MTWDKCLELGATRLSTILGCPVTTAHSWIRRSGPPDWQKPHFMAAIEHAEAKREKRVSKNVSKGH